MFLPVRRNFLIALALLSGIVAFAFPPSSGARTQFTDAAKAADAAFAYSYLESIGDYNTEYDFIHPDARAVIPRAAVVGWFMDNYWPRQPQPATITGVQFVSWMWPVTGVTYPDTAEVSFTQVFWDNGANTVENDVVRLVQDRNGVWRWFFGRSRDFVDQVIQIYVPQVPQTSYTGDVLIDSSVNDVDAFWQQFFRTEVETYESPEVVLYDRAVLSSCVAADPDAVGSFYCAADRAVYLSVPELQFFAVEFGEVTVPLIVAHEWGHHVQNELGLLGIGLSIELQADCLAGGWARDYATRYGMTEDEVLRGKILMITIGDPAFVPSTDPTAHGPGSQRTHEFLEGFYDGIQACFA